MNNRFNITKVDDETILMTDEQSELHFRFSAPNAGWCILRTYLSENQQWSASPIVDIEDVVGEFLINNYAEAAF